MDWIQRYIKPYIYLFEYANIFIDCSGSIPVSLSQCNTLKNNYTYMEMLKVPVIVYVLRQYIILHGKNS